jgi:hypothetical protein
MSIKSQFNNFNINNIINHSNIAIIGKRRSGKSSLVKKILNYKNINNIYVISETEKFNPFYSDFIPKENIYHEYKTEILDDIYNKKNNKILIMDNCMNKNIWLKDTNILELFFNSRHYNLSFILTMEYPLDIPPELRSNLDYVFLLNQDETNNKYKLY